MQSIAICSTHFRCRAAILPRLHHDLDHHCVHICKGFGGFIYIIIYIIYKLYKLCIFARVWVVEPAASGKQHFLSLFNNRDSHPCHQKYLKNNLRPWVNKYCLQFSYFMKCGAVLKTFVNKEKTFVGNFHCGDVHCPLQRPFFNFRNRNLIQFHFLPLSSIVF